MSAGDGFEVAFGDNGPLGCILARLERRTSFHAHLALAYSTFSHPRSRMRALPCGAIPARLSVSFCTRSLARAPSCRVRRLQRVQRRLRSTPVLTTLAVLPVRVDMAYTSVCAGVGYALWLKSTASVCNSRFLFSFLVRAARLSCVHPLSFPSSFRR
ncbi:hypothetical protein PLICRDRAFT_657538 [Plicaturopsis crispa FD-325 SS-3]|nr:hypothetical protein PLICRDRAFT_657538 [Plicaturopsis crispa FD-325 SS-3]